MKRLSLYNVIFGIFALSFLLVGGLIYFSVTSRQQDLFQAAIDEKIKLAQTIKETVASPSWAYQMSLLKDSERELIISLSKFKDVRFIRIVTAQGEIRQSTLEGETGKKIKDKDIGSVIQSGKLLIRDETLRGEDLKSLIYPSYEDQAIWVSFSLKDTRVSMEELLWRYLLIALIALLLLSGTMIIILKSIVNPIRKITASCEDVRKGNFDIKLEGDWHTEIGELAETFNRMLRDIKESHQSLEEAKAVLEIRVAARTRELQDLTQSLEEQVKARTNDLQEKMKELERFNRLAIDRELKMIELKEELKQLKEK